MKNKKEINDYLDFGMKMNDRLKNNKNKMGEMLNPDIDDLIEHGIKLGIIYAESEAIKSTLIGHTNVPRIFRELHESLVAWADADYLSIGAFSEMLINPDISKVSQLEDLFEAAGKSELEHIKKLKSLNKLLLKLGKLNS